MTDPAQTTTTQEPRYASKFADENELAKGIAEIRKPLGLDPLDPETPIIGEQGIYTTPAAAEKAYLDMQALLGRRGQQQDNGQQTQPPDESADEPADTQQQQHMKIDDAPVASVDDVLSRAGLKAKELSSKWAEKGELDGSDYEALQKQGYPRQLVDGYMSGLAQQANQLRSEAATVVGGEEQLNALLNTAPSFVPRDEIGQFNERLADPKRFKGAIRDLMDMHRQAVGAGNAQPLNTQGTTPPAQAPGFQDWPSYAQALRRRHQGTATAEDIERLNNTKSEVIQQGSM